MYWFHLFIINGLATILNSVHNINTNSFIISLMLFSTHNHPQHRLHDPHQRYVHNYFNAPFHRFTTLFFCIIFIENTGKCRTVESFLFCCQCAGSWLVNLYQKSINSILLHNIIDILIYIFTSGLIWFCFKTNRLRQMLSIWSNGTKSSISFGK